MRNVALIQKAAKDNWQAAAWYLERRYPEDYGRREQHKLEHTGPRGGPIQTEKMQDISKLSVKEREQMLGMLEKIEPEKEIKKETAKQ